MSRTTPGRAQVGQQPPGRPYRSPVPRTHYAPASTPRDPVAALAAHYAGDLVRTVADRRDTLPKAPNGRPKPSTSPTAAQIRKEMGQGRSREWQRLLTVGLADLADGVPVGHVLADFRRAEAILIAHAPTAVHPAPGTATLSGLNRRETRLDCALDLAQLGVEAHPDDPTALEALLTAIQHYRPVLDTIEQAATARLVTRTRPAPAP